MSWRDILPAVHDADAQRQAGERRLARECVHFDQAADALGVCVEEFVAAETSRVIQSTRETRSR